MAISGNALRAGKAVIELSLLNKTQAGLAAIEARVAKFGESLSNVGAIGLKASGAFVAAFAGAAKMFSTIGDDIAKAAKRTGFAVESVSALKFAADQSGTSFETIERATKGLAKNLLESEGGGGITETLSRLGLSVAQLRAQKPEQQFLTIADALSKVSDPSLKAALAMDIFGKSGAELIPLLDEGKTGITALVAEARKLGVVMSADDAKAAEELNDAFGRLKAQFQAVALSIGGAVAGPLTAWLSKSRESLATSIRWIQSHSQLVITFAKLTTAVAGTSAVVFALGKAIQATSVAVGALRVAITFLTAHPLVLLGTLLAGLVLYLGHTTGALDAIYKKFGLLGTGADAATGKVNQFTEAIARLNEQGDAALAA